jgi:hypothetical protein
MADIAQLAEQPPPRKGLSNFFAHSTKWLKGARRIGDALFGVVFTTAVFLIALEIHWALHRLLGG